MKRNLKKLETNFVGVVYTAHVIQLLFFLQSLRDQLFRATTALTFGRDGETGEEPGINDIQQELER